MPNSCHPHLELSAEKNTFSCQADCGFTSWVLHSITCGVGESFDLAKPQSPDLRKGLTTACDPEGSSGDPMSKRTVKCFVECLLGDHHWTLRPFGVCISGLQKRLHGSGSGHICRTNPPCDGEEEDSSGQYDSRALQHPPFTVAIFYDSHA